MTGAKPLRDPREKSWCQTESALVWFTDIAEVSQRVCEGHSQGTNMEPARGRLQGAPLRGLSPRVEASVRGQRDSPSACAGIPFPPAAGREAPFRQRLIRSRREFPNRPDQMNKRRQVGVYPITGPET